MDKRFFKCIFLAALFAVSDSVSAEIIKGKIVNEKNNEEIIEL